MILPVGAWMDLRRYQPLRDAGATWREIADEVGLDWRTVKKYLSADTSSGPPVAPSRRGCVTRKVDVVAPVIDAWLAADPRLRASVIHERLVAEHGFDGHYQRIKLYVPPRPANAWPATTTPAGCVGCTAGSRSSPGRRPGSTGATRAPSCSSRAWRRSTRST